MSSICQLVNAKNEAGEEKRLKIKIKQVLGKHAYKAFLESKKKEWDSFRMFVSQWEIDNYIVNY